MGHSPDHANDVALVLNPRTGLVSPQYHVVFDDSFNIISHLKSEAPPPKWNYLNKSCCENKPDDIKDTELIQF